MDRKKIVFEAEELESGNMVRGSLLGTDIMNYEVATIIEPAEAEYRVDGIFIAREFYYDVDPGSVKLVQSTPEPFDASMVVERYVGLESGNLGEVYYYRFKINKHTDIRVDLEDKELRIGKYCFPLPETWTYFEIICRLCGIELKRRGG